MSISNEDLVQTEEMEQPSIEGQGLKFVEVDENKKTNLYNGEPYKIVHISFDVHKAYKDYVQKSGVYKLHKLIDQALREWMVARQNDNLYKEIRKHTDTVLASLSQLSTITSMLNKINDARD